MTNPKSNVFCLFEEQALKCPDRVCLKVCPESSEINFGQLLNNANKLALMMSQNKLQVGDKILIEGSKSIESFSLLLAALKMGVAYCFYDPQSPSHRLKQIVDSLNPSLIFHMNTKNLEWASGIKKLSFDKLNLILTEANLEEPALSKTVSVTSDTSAYVIFTSGSTGVPKGVCITHGNLYPFINWARECFQINKSTIGTNLNPLFFDNSVFDIFSTLFNGGSLVSVDATRLSNLSEIIDIVFEEKCTQWFSVPSMLIYLNTVKCINSEKLIHLEHIIFGGEGYPLPLLKKLIKHGNINTQFWNVYGPSECTCISNAVSIDLDELTDSQSPFYHLGKVLSHFDYLINYEDSKVDDSSKARPIGELVLIGSSVGKGYINPNAVEKSGFHTLPSASGRPVRAYRTGDLFSLDHDQNLCFVGRDDHQIKRSGYRIELQEVEAVVLSTDIIEEAVAITFGAAGQTNIRLYVYCKINISVSILEDQIAEILPHYMMPDDIIISDSFLKKNANGKIDRKYYKELFIENSV